VDQPEADGGQHKERGRHRQHDPCPGPANHESTSKQKCRGTRNGNSYLKTTLVAAFRILQRAVAFADLGADYLDHVDKHRIVRRLVRRLNALGYAVMLHPKPTN